MLVLDSAVTIDLAAGGGALMSLRAHGLRDGFHAWYGASGRRYVASVFVFDPCARDAGLPAFEAFVLIPTLREGTQRRACTVEVVEWGSARHRAVAAAIEGGVDEWHVHLLGASRAEREAIAADLRAGASLGAAARPRGRRSGRARFFPAGERRNIVSSAARPSARVPAPAPLRRWPCRQHRSPARRQPASSRNNRDTRG